LGEATGTLSATKWSVVSCLVILVGGRTGAQAYPDLGGPYFGPADK
jgi:hypothetical protein